MSEKSIAELIGSLRRQSPGTAEHYACVAVLDARIARAEAAERLAEAFGAVIDSVDGHAPDDGKLNEAWQEYVAAREAVRKLEDEQ